MKKRVLLLLALALFSLTAFAQRQNETTGEMKVHHLTAGEGTLSFTLDLASLELGSQELLIVTPILKHNNGSEEYLLEPLFVAGKTRAAALERETLLGNPRPYMTPAPQSITVRRSGAKQSVSYAASFPMQEWMQDASLSLKTVHTGCAACGLSQGTLFVSNRLIDKSEPSFLLAYVTPPVEDPKIRADKYTATIEFAVDKTDINPALRDNTDVLGDVDEKVVAILKNPDFKASKVEIVGYASPEASVKYNKDLAEKRAAAFADFLSAKYGVSRKDFTSRGYGEDWTMARALIEKGEGNLSDEMRSKVLAIIDDTPDRDARDGKIRALDGGKTYNELLTRVWPKIRRTEYTVSYSVRPFDVEEAKAMLKKDPRLLSLNEMYLVARTYDPDSYEYKEVFDIAGRLFPDEPVSLINSAAADLEQGSYARALKVLPALGDSPEALNNLGVALALSGDLAAARTTLEKAVALGSAEARHNLSELDN